MNLKTILENQKVGKYDIKVIGLSLLGLNHMKSCMQNQDSMAYSQEGDYISIAVADGVGSCINSHIGSKVAMDVVRDFLYEIVNSYIKPENEIEIKNYIIKKWEEKIGTKQIQYSTTLRFAIICEKYVLVGSIGDGKTIIKIDDSESYLSIEDDLFINVTYSLTENTEKNKMQIVKIDVPDDTNTISIFISSDGITNEIAHGKEFKLLSHIIDKVKEAGNDYQHELSKWMKSLQKINGDDKTMLILVAERIKTYE